MSLLKALAEKPWLPQTAGADFAPVPGPLPSNPGRTALKFFIAVASVIFFLLTITFLSRTQYPDFQALIIKKSTYNTNQFTNLQP